jgi:rsbT co-antagonist protein RsbR
MKKESIVNRAQEHQPSYEQLQQQVADLQAKLAHTQQMVEKIPQLEQELQIFKTTLNNAPDGIAISDLEGVVTYVNPAFQARLGYGEKTLEKPIYNFTPEYALENLGKAFDAVKQHGKWQGELDYRCADGSIFPGIVSAFTVVDTAGRPQAVAAIIRDITERKQQENWLRAFEKLIETSPDGIGISSLDGTITYANPALQNLTKYGKTLLGNNFLTLYPEKEHATIQKSSQEVISKGFWQGQLQLQTVDGHIIPVQLSSFILYDSQGNPASLTGIFRDLTEQQQYEEERTRLQEQIIEAQRESLRELSTPLLPISQHVLAMPLVGTIDSSRAQQIMEALLEGIAQYQAEMVLVDITGVKVIDTQVAQAIIRTAQAVQLLGAQIVLTGIQPQIALTLVHLGADMSGIVTRGTLQSGIAYALAQK